MKRFAVLPLCLVLAAAYAEETTLKEVTVTSTADDIAERRQATTQKIIVTREDIENMGVLTVGDVMGKLPGIDASAPSPHGAMSLRSRGMTRDSVQVLVDGEKVPGHARMAQSTVGRLPSSELERVEILRGASAEFGGNAPVTVNLVFKRPPSKDSTALKAAVGYRDERPNTLLSFTKGGGDKSFSWSLPLTFHYHNIPSGSDVARRDYTGTRQEKRDDGYFAMKAVVFSPRFTWKSGRDNLTLSPSLYRGFARRINDSTRTDYVTPADSSRRHDDEHTRTAFDRLRGEGEMIRQGVKYSTRFAGSDGERRSNMKRTTIDTLGTASVSDEQTRSRERDVNGMLRLDWGTDKHAWSAAVEAFAHHRRDTRTDSGAGEESHTGRDRQWSLWLQDEWGVANGVTLTSGLRSEFIRYDMDSNGRRYRRLLPSIAVRWEPAPQWVLRSSLGGGIKQPKLSELSSQPVYSVGTNTPTEPDQRGNPDLRAERSANFEAVLERYLPDEMGVFGANVYVRRTRDFIERHVQFEGSRWVERPWNEGDALHWGLEIDGKLRTDKLGWKGATLRAHLTLPRSRVHDERLGLTRAARETPRYLLSAGYDQTLLGGLSFGASMRHSAVVRTDVAGEEYTVTRRRTVVDAYVLRKLTPQINLRLSLGNLFKADTDRQSDYTSGSDWWSLVNSTKAARKVELSLEGKW